MYRIHNEFNKVCSEFLICIKKVGINMKKTLLFSNIVGDVTANHNVDLRFYNHMSDNLLKNIEDNYKLVFINAPGLGGEENYLKNIIKCFNNIGIEFAEIFDLEFDSKLDELEDFIDDENKIVYFLMGGNPLTQIDIINKFNLNERIRNHNGLVIGFCAGAINLSKYSIITTDDDFDEIQSYKGIERVNIIVEPHYNVIDNQNRNEELKNFAIKYNQKIYAIPDDSFIVVEEDNIIEYGNIYYIEV